MSSTAQISSVSVLLGLLISLAWLTGCGGGGQGPPSKAEFVVQANAVCRHAIAEQRALAPPELKTLPPANRSSYVEPILVKSIEAELRGLKTLEPPPADRKEIKLILGGIEKGIEDAKLDPLDPLVKATDPFARPNRLARQFGLRACAESSHAVIRPGTFAQLYETGK